MVPRYLRELAWYYKVPRCFSFVDNSDGKFVIAIIELPFTGAFVTNGWLPNIVVNMKATNS